MRGFYGTEDFRFQLTREEIEFVKSQIVISRENNFFEGQGGGRRTLPYAFTEQGIYMLATVLRGEIAEQQSIFIMRAFREMRHYIKQNQQFVTQPEMRLVTAKVSEISVQVASNVDWKNKAEKRFDSIQRSIDILNENFISDKDFKNFVIYKGQKFEADAAYIDIYQQAQKGIYVVDDYGLSTEQAYHCGASSKDAGRKLCAINAILETSMIHPVIDKMLLAPDKHI